MNFYNREQSNSADSLGILMQCDLSFQPDNLAAASGSESLPLDILPSKFAAISVGQPTASSPDLRYE